MEYTIEVIAAIQGIILVVVGWSAREIIVSKISHTRSHECIKRIEGILTELKERFDESHKTTEV